MKNPSAFKLILLALIAALAAAGCAAPLDFTYAPAAPHKRPSTTVTRTDQADAPSAKPPAVVMAGFADARPSGAGTAAIGAIASPVFGMDGAKLVLTRPPALIVEEAFTAELKAAGHEVHAPGSPGAAAAAYAVKGEVKAFRLDVEARDNVEITVSTTMTDLKTGTPVWSGDVTEKSDRFAGVSGNTKKTISDYLSASLSKVVRNTINAAFGAAVAAEPSAARQAVQPATPPGDKAAASAKGRLSVRSAPERAKVYVNGVYYGLTPLVVELDGGIYEVTVKAAGFKDMAEKVAVDAERTTEMEAALEK